MSKFCSMLILYKHLSGMKQNRWFLGFYIQDAPFLKCHKKFNLKLFMRLDLDVFRDAIFMMGVLKNENDST